MGGILGKSIARKRLASPWNLGAPGLTQWGGGFRTVEKDANLPQFCALSGPSRTICLNPDGWSRFPGNRRDFGRVGAISGRHQPSLSEGLLRAG